MHRRALLGGAVAAAALSTTADASSGQAAALRLSTTAYRRLDGSTSLQDLEDAVQAHLRLIQATARTADGKHRIRLAAVGSEAADLSGWLAWDMGNHGSARARYAAAVNTARSAGNPLLIAYQVGSLASFEAHAGNGVQALNLAVRARRVLRGRSPAVADAWLSSIEALGPTPPGTGGQRTRPSSAPVRRPKACPDSNSHHRGLGVLLHRREGRRPPCHLRRLARPARLGPQ